MPLNILFERDIVGVIDKPPGLATWQDSEDESSLAKPLLEQFPELRKLGKERRYGIVHRLDKDTSGVLMVAKTPESFSFFQEQFRKRRIQKKYLCLVQGILREDEGTVHTLLGRSPGDRRKQKASPFAEYPALGQREAETLYRVISRYDEGYTLLEVSPKTGRKHQIRAHMAYLHHPIVGDTLYAFRDTPVPQGLSRQFLHAAELTFLLPSEEEITVTAKLPEDLRHVLDQLHPYENQT